MTRVAFFDAYPHTYAGAQRSTLVLAQSLGRRGWEVEVMMPAGGAFASRLAQAAVPHHVVAAPPSLHHYGHSTTGWRAAAAAIALPRYWWRLRRTLRERADLVHVNDQRGLVLAGPAARLARVPVVWHVHGVRPPQWLNVVGRLIAKRTIALSADDAERLATPRSRVTPVVVANAPPDELFAIERRPVAPPLVVTTARLSPIKGIDVLLRAMAILHDVRPEVTAVVMGGEQLGYAEHVGELERLRVALGLEQTVSFAGHVDDPASVLATASLYVQPARWEGVPLAVLEAMAIGLPVVATDVGGVRQLIEPDVTGVLVAPDDPKALADAMQRLLDDPETAGALGQAGQASVRQRYSADASLSTLLEIYRAVLS